MQKTNKFFIFWIKFIKEDIKLKIRIKARADWVDLVSDLNILERGGTAFILETEI